MNRTASTAPLLVPSPFASDKEWKAFADLQCQALLPHLQSFLTGRFGYSPRHVKTWLHSVFGTVTATTKRYDVRILMFGRPSGIYPRRRLVLSRIVFEEQRVGHGRALVELLAELAPSLGYQCIVIESTNASSAAFAQRLGFMPDEHGRNWLLLLDEEAGLDADF